MYLLYLYSVEVEMYAYIDTHTYRERDLLQGIGLDMIWTVYTSVKPPGQADIKGKSPG